MPLTARQEEMIRKAVPMDDLTIRLMLRENPELAELLCRIILAINNLRVVKLRTQYDASRGGIARGVTLDALVEDDKGRVENFEIQINARGWSPKRGRYHAAVLDIEYLDAGSGFSALPESFVIFFCDGDPYGKNEPVYVVKRTVWTTDHIDYTKGKDYIRDYGDSEYILYVNGAWRGDDALGRLMHDFHCADPNDMHYPQMAKRLRYLKETEKGKMEMAGLAEKIYNDGKTDERREIAQRMLDDGSEPAWVARIVELPLDVVESIAANRAVSKQNPDQTPTPSRH